MTFFNMFEINGSKKKDASISLAGLDREQIELPLPEPIRRAIEQLSGVDMGDVRVHYNSFAPDIFNAQAMAFGNRIYLGPAAEHTLPHEAWHVVQQKQGRVRATFSMQGIPVSDSQSLEIEACQMGALSERLSVYGTAGIDRLDLVVRSIAEPVLQRWIKFAGKIYNYKDLRTYLEENKEPPQGGIKFFDRVLRDMDEHNVTLNDWKAFTREVEMRSFGYQHHAALEKLRYKNHDAYIDQNASSAMAQQNLKKKDLNIQSQQPTTVNLSAMDIRTINEASTITDNTKNYIYWVSGSHLTMDSAHRFVRGNFLRPYAAWVFNYVPGNTRFGHPAGNAPKPRCMNCYEAVLYSSYGIGMVDTKYLLWAGELEQLDWTNLPRYNNENNEDKENARFINVMMQDNSTLIPQIGTAQEKDADGQRTGRRKVYAVPKHIPRGRVVVFSRGAHVALATGAIKPIQSAAARSIYGSYGHELIELDGDQLKNEQSSILKSKQQLSTATLRLTTLEDRLLAKQNTYNMALHIGPLPNISVGRQIVFRKIYGSDRFGNGNIRYNEYRSAVDLYDQLLW